jgi:hypothetical protein
MSLLSTQAFAKTEIIYASHRSVMGDNDSKNDVRWMCFLEAKRKVLEKAGTYIESQSEVKDFQLNKDEITTFAAALLRVDVVQEEWMLAGENLAILMKVKAEVDTDYVEKQLSKIQKDISVQRKIKDQQRQLQVLERKVVSLQKQLATADAPKAAPLRKERNVVFKQIDELEEKKIAILSRIKAKTAGALKYIERGMTKIEVRSLIGHARSTAMSGDRWNYGDVWVVFEHGIVRCMIYQRKDCLNTISPSPCEIAQCRAK